MRAARGGEGDVDEGGEVDVNEVDEIDEMDIDKVREEEEDTQTETPSETPTITPIQQACLQFCIALLNQSITRREYDNTLVCALAILGVREDRWKGPEMYPPILLAVIKVACFMVV